jgi:hypothetical protein
MHSKYESKYIQKNGKKTCDVRMEKISRLGINFRYIYQLYSSGEVTYFFTTSTLLCELENQQCLMFCKD